MAAASAFAANPRPERRWSSACRRSDPSRAADGRDSAGGMNAMALRRARIAKSVAVDDVIIVSETLPAAQAPLCIAHVLDDASAMRAFARSPERFPASVAPRTRQGCYLPVIALLSQCR